VGDMKVKKASFWQCALYIPSPFIADIILSSLHATTNNAPLQVMNNNKTNPKPKN
jgi:hypothetical protein